MQVPEKEAEKTLMNLKESCKSQKTPKKSFLSD